MIAKWLIRPQWQGYDKIPDTVILTADACLLIDDKEFWIPKGYYSDGASIPALGGLLWKIVGTPFEPDNCEPGLGHDPLYLTHAVSRKVADEVLYQLKLVHELRVETPPKKAKWKARRMWLGVRIFGIFAWHNSKKDLEELERMKVLISQREDIAKFRNLWFSKEC